MTTRPRLNQLGLSTVRSANRTLVLVSDGTRAGDDTMLEKARDHDESLRFVDSLKNVLAKYPS